MVICKGNGTIIHIVSSGCKRSFGGVIKPPFILYAANTHGKVFSGKYMMSLDAQPHHNQQELSMDLSAR